MCVHRRVVRCPEDSLSIRQEYDSYCFCARGSSFPVSKDLLQFNPSSFMYGTSRNRCHCISFPPTATYPYIQMSISLSRKVSYHIMNTYIPSGLFVVVSWLTFLIPTDIVPGRMVLTITTLLTMVSMFNTVRLVVALVSIIRYACCCHHDRYPGRNFYSTITVWVGILFFALSVFC